MNIFELKRYFEIYISDRYDSKQNNVLDRK